MADLAAMNAQLVGAAETQESYSAQLAAHVVPLRACEDRGSSVAQYAAEHDLSHY